ncbi:hypothetical protein B0H12DRAFT_411704 [Mycena haematopus]|nr:hypothetical protein B0H12DRAFT_411704 [Mycena haematopus]
MDRHGHLGDNKLSELSHRRRCLGHRQPTSSTELDPTLMAIGGSHYYAAYLAKGQCIPPICQLLDFPSSYLSRRVLAQPKTSRFYVDTLDHGFRERLVGKLFLKAAAIMKTAWQRRASGNIFIILACLLFQGEEKMPRRSQKAVRERGLFLNPSSAIKLVAQPSTGSDEASSSSGEALGSDEV